MKRQIKMRDICVEKMTTSTMIDVKDICDLSFSVPWSLSSLEKELTNPNALYIVVKLGEKVVGFGGIWVVFDEATVINIAVHPDYRGIHISDIIMENLINKAKSMGACSMTLEVRISNITAIKLYEKYGFIIEGTRKNFYDNPKEDGHIMWKYNI
ncbi:MAG: ribosomal protein S18-alanine N-acetyltransferase [Clostridium sp.]|nr:ribosomal protein S18-alanine N-acetyltransferase [Clostridium sp.]